MKKFGVLALILSLALVGCKKEETTTPSTAGTESSTTSTEGGDTTSTEGGSTESTEAK